MKKFTFDLHFQDEVSRELKLKQQELRQIADASRPTINQLFERIQAEYALYETSRRLDLADDKVSCHFRVKYYII